MKQKSAGRSESARDSASRRRQYLRERRLINWSGDRAGLRRLSTGKPTRQREIPDVIAARHKYRRNCLLRVATQCATI